MRAVTILIGMVACFASPSWAQHGAAYPDPGADRGPAYPKNISPTDSNPTNWVVQKPVYTDQYGPWQYDRFYYRRRYR